MPKLNATSAQNNFKEENMHLTMLGTGSASVKNCYNTCFVFTENGQNFLVDAGGGNQILKILDDENISVTEYRKT